MMEICLLAESYGTPYPNNSADGPSSLAFNLAKALNKYSDLHFEMYVLNNINPLCSMPNVFQTPMPPNLDRGFFESFDCIHVLNGYWASLLMIGLSLNERTIIGPNVVFKTFPSKKKQLYERLSPQEILRYEHFSALEQYICSFKWKKILAPNSEYSDEYIRRFGCSEDDIRALWAGIDTELFRPGNESDRHYITWVAKADSRNYPVMKEIIQAFPEEEFALCGLNERYNYFEHPKTLLRSKLYIGTSEESQGIAVFEAMACGVPTITLQQHLYSEHNVNTIKVDSQEMSPNAGAYIDAIRMLLEDPSLMKRIGQGGLEHVRKNYSLEQMAKLYMDIIKNC